MFKAVRRVWAKYKEIKALEAKAKPGQLQQQKQMLADIKSKTKAEEALVRLSTTA